MRFIDAHSGPLTHTREVLVDSIGDNADESKKRVLRAFLALILDLKWAEEQKRQIHSGSRDGDESSGGRLDTPRRAAGHLSTERQAWVIFRWPTRHPTLIQSSLDQLGVGQAD